MRLSLWIKSNKTKNFTSLTSNNVQKKLKLNAVLLKLMLKLMSNGMEKKTEIC